MYLNCDYIHFPINLYYSWIRILYFIVTFIIIIFFLILNMNNYVLKNSNRKDKKYMLIN